MATKLLPALAEAMATEPVLDWALMPALALVTAPEPRLPEDLSTTPFKPDTAPVVRVPAVTSRSTVPALLVTTPTLVLPTASSVMLPLAVPLVPVKVVPAVKVAVPPLTVYVGRDKLVLASTNKPVPALAEAKATEPAVDWALMPALVLVSAPVLRLPEDLSKTAMPPDTAPVVNVPAVTSRSTVPALLVTAPTLALPTVSKVMLPLAVPVVPMKVVPAVKLAVPPLTV